MLQFIESSEPVLDLPSAVIFARQSPPPDYRISLLWEKGLLLERLGRGEEARENWIALLGLDPSHLGALSRLGGILAAAGENQLALEIFSEAVAQYPGDPMSRVNLANILIKEEQHEQAREQLECALSLNPNFRPAHAGLAFILPRLGEPEQAAWHGRVAFQGRCLVGSQYRGEGTPITVLELISTLEMKRPLRPAQVMVCDGPSFVISVRANVVR